MPQLIASIRALLCCSLWLFLCSSLTAKSLPNRGDVDSRRTVSTHSSGAHRLFSRVQPAKRFDVSTVDTPEVWKTFIKTIANALWDPSTFDSRNFAPKIGAPCLPIVGRPWVEGTTSYLTLHRYLYMSDGQESTIRPSITGLYAGNYVLRWHVFASRVFRDKATMPMVWPMLWDKRTSQRITMFRRFPSPKGSPDRPNKPLRSHSSASEAFFTLTGRPSEGPFDVEIHLDTRWSEINFLGEKTRDVSADLPDESMVVLALFRENDSFQERSKVSWKTKLMAKIKPFLPSP